MGLTTTKEPKIDIYGRPEEVFEKLEHAVLNANGNVLNIAVIGDEGTYAWYAYRSKDNQIKVDWKHPYTGVSTKCSVNGEAYADCNECPNGAHANKGPCEHDTIQKFLRGETDSFDAQLAKLAARYQ
ncbi:MAG: hypothetical protein KAI53_05830 [Candidatus Aenigmarchaeota archaeon]|nr:hypothetical protein [Candidatus Aenigmarchaeota archaeon]